MSEHMTITDLISQLQAIERRNGGDTQVVIRKGVGWSGIETQYFNMDLVAVPASKEDGVWYANMEQDYEACRTEMLTGTKDSVAVLALWASDYEMTNIHPDEVRSCNYTRMTGDE